MLVVWSIKKLAPESIQPAPDYGEVSAVHMPEQRWVIDLLFAFRVEHELGIGKLNFYSLRISDEQAAAPFHMSAGVTFGIESMGYSGESK